MSTRFRQSASGAEGGTAMTLTRRDFIKGVGTGTAVAATAGVDAPQAEAYTPELKT